MPGPSYPGTPRWTKAFAGAAIVLLLLLIAIRTSGIRGEHGPDRHMVPDAHDGAQLNGGSGKPAEDQHDQRRGGHR